MYSRVKKFEPYLVVYLQGYKFLLGKKKQTNRELIQTECVGAEL